MNSFSCVSSLVDQSLFHSLTISQGSTCRENNEGCVCFVYNLKFPEVNQTTNLIRGVLIETNRGGHLGPSSLAIRGPQEELQWRDHIKEGLEAPLLLLLFFFCCAESAVTESAPSLLFPLPTSSPQLEERYFEVIQPTTVVTAQKKQLWESPSQWLQLRHGFQL